MNALNKANDLLDSYGFGHRRDVSPIFTDAKRAAAYVRNYVSNLKAAWKGDSTR